MRRVSIEQLEPGEVLDSPLYSSSRQLLLKEGTELTSSHISNLADRGIEFVLTASEKFADRAGDPAKKQQTKQQPVERERSTSELSGLIEEIGEGYPEELERAGLEHPISGEVLRNLQEELGKVLDSRGAELKTGGLEELVSEVTQDLIGRPDYHDTLLLLSDYSELRLNHCINVMTLLVAQQATFGAVTPELALGALLHDIAAPKEALEDGALDVLREAPGADLEEEIHSYPERSAQMLGRALELPEEVDSMIRDHRERFDGAGYPDGKGQGELSPLALRLGIADSYDLSVLRRSEQGVISYSKAMGELLERGKKLFGQQTVNEFVKVVGFYPVGTMVKLSTGEFGVIREINENHRTRPVVSVLYDDSLTPVEPPEELDLSAVTGIYITESM